MKNIKIATILPYKENYTFSKAQAAAIWVSDFFKNSKFEKILLTLLSNCFILFFYLALCEPSHSG